MHWLSVLGGNANGRRRFAAVRGKTTQLKKMASVEGRHDLRGDDCDGMMLIEPQNMIQSIFLDCDKDNDGALSSSEYSAFLRTIGSWGKHKYTDETWDEQWCVHSSHTALAAFSCAKAVVLTIWSLPAWPTPIPQAQRVQKPRRGSRNWHRR